MTQVPEYAPDRPRSVAVTLGAIAVVAMSLILGLSLLTLTLSDDATQMAALLPMLILLFTGWLWAGFAIVAIKVGLGTSRPDRPVLLGVIAIIEILVALLVLFL